MKHLITIIFMILLTTSCTTTKYVEVPVETIKTEYITKLQHDSIYIHDSIDRYISNDTVYYTNYKYIDKYHIVLDTVVKTDSINIPVIQEVEKITEVNKLNFLQKFFMFIGIISLTALVVYLLVKFKA